mgnify:CR=1 FL=1
MAVLAKANLYEQFEILHFSEIFKLIISMKCRKQFDCATVYVY